MKVIDVAAALIFRKGKLLLTRRHPDVHLGGLWEFPGGKREEAETFETCLARELREELGLCAAVGDEFARVTYQYPEKAVHLRFFVCECVEEEPRALGCAEFRWVNEEELPEYKFPAADEPVVTKLLAQKERWRNPTQGSAT